MGEKLLEFKNTTKIVNIKEKLEVEKISQMCSKTQE
jgi:hypothetical protein